VLCAVNAVLKSVRVSLERTLCADEELSLILLHAEIFLSVDHQKVLADYQQVGFSVIHAQDHFEHFYRVSCGGWL
jgi:hypothetical protein